MAIIIMVGAEGSSPEKFERALTTTEAAAVLMPTHRRLRELLNNGEITPYEEQLGNYQLFLARDVEDLRQRRLKRF